MRLSEVLGYPIRNTPFYARPLCFISAVFLCALFLIQISVALFAVYAVAVIVYAVTLLIISRWRTALPYIILLALLLAMLLPMPRFLEARRMERITGEHTVKVTVTDIYYEEMYASLYKVEILEIDGMEVSGNAEMLFDHDPILSEYDTVTAVCEVKPPTDADTVMVKSEDIRLSLEVSEIKDMTDESRKGLAYRIFTLRERIGARLDKALPSETASYARALLIGDKSGLGATFRTDMSALGISHILAVSGMHMSVIAAVITVLADRIRSSRRLKSALLIAGGALFTAVAGFSPSVTRAMLMMSLGLIAVFFGMRGDTLTSLMLSGVIICAVEPLNAISCSFLLSFFATLGITVCSIYIDNYAGIRLRSSRVGDMRYLYGIVRYFLLSLAVTVCATLFTAPVLAMYFSEISYFSVVMNLVAIPMATVSMILTLISFALGDSFIGQGVGKAFSALYGAFEGLIHTVSRSASTSVSLRYPFFYICLAILLAAFVFIWIARIRSPLAVLSAFLAVTVLYAGSVQIYSAVTHGRTDVIYLADGNSEVIAVKSGAQSVLIDICNGSRAVPERGSEEILESFYETEIDIYMLTHYHTDHIGTLKRMLRRCRIDKIYLPKPENEREEAVFAELVRVSEHTEPVEYKRGEPISIGEASVITLPYSLIERSEHPVIGLEISTAVTSLTYLGSSVSESGVMLEAEVMVGRADTLICGSHGPVTKENIPYLGFDPECEVLLSPFEDSNEGELFRGGSFFSIREDSVSGIARARIRLS